MLRHWESLLDTAKLTHLLYLSGIYGGDFLASVPAEMSKALQLCSTNRFILDLAIFQSSEGSPSWNIRIFTLRGKNYSIRGLCQICLYFHGQKDLFWFILWRIMSPHTLNIAPITWIKRCEWWNKHGGSVSLLVTSCHPKCWTSSLVPFGAVEAWFSLFSSATPTQRSSKQNGSHMLLKAGLVWAMPPICSQVFISFLSSRPNILLNPNALAMEEC